MPSFHWTHKVQTLIILKLLQTISALITALIPYAFDVRPDQKLKYKKFPITVHSSSTAVILLSSSHRFA